MKRYLTDTILKDLDSKMVFLAGPRQVGKTTTAKEIIQLKKGGRYLNWDIPQDRKQILTREIPSEDLIVYDEIHRYRQWRNYLKGIYDQYSKSKKILVTGSAKLDLYKYSGDSLQGRYHFLRIHPLSFKELKGQGESDLEQLLMLGGFPEPFLSGSQRDANRWSLEYRNRLLTEEITSIEQIKDLGQMELLMIRLPELVGSPLSLNSLREDIQVSHDTITRWVEVIERFYGIFRISPFGSIKFKAVKKEQKHYHYDWNLVEDEGARFENMIACHLLKWCNYLYDTEGRELDLRYFRDTTGREVDFIVLEKSKPLMAIECKSSDKEVSKSLIYFKKRFPNTEAYQISKNSNKDCITKDTVRHIPATKFLNMLI